MSTGRAVGPRRPWCPRCGRLMEEGWGCVRRDERRRIAEALAEDAGRIAKGLAEDADRHMAFSRDFERVAYDQGWGDALQTWASYIERNELEQE